MNRNVESLISMKAVLSATVIISLFIGAEYVSGKFLKRSLPDKSTIISPEESRDTVREFYQHDSPNDVKRRRRNSKFVIAIEDSDEDQETVDRERKSVEELESLHAEVATREENGIKENELGQDTVEDLKELEAFYKSTKDSIVKIHNARILETQDSTRRKDNLGK